MREEFLIERQGKQFVLFAGLLDEFHTRFTGSKSITTEMLQPPHDMNGNICVVKARVEAMDHEGNVLVFEGIGDASAENVGRNIAPHIIRMAETRAKARALRDAINVGVTSLEELGSDDESQPRRSTRSSEARSTRNTRDGSTGSEKPRSSSGASGKVSPGQVTAIANLVDFVHGISLEEYEGDYLGDQISVASMSTEEATAIYQSLSKEKREIQESERA